MSKRKAIVFRIDSRLLAAVEKWAADEFRSTNGQLEWIVARALQQAGRLKNEEKQEDENSGRTET